MLCLLEEFTFYLIDYTDASYFKALTNRVAGFGTCKLKRKKENE